MKICIPIQEDRGLESKPYGHFGSAPLFLLCDTETGATEAIDNGDEHHQHGACHPMKALQGKSVEAIVVGGIGGRAVMKLNEQGVKVFRSTEDTVEKNLELLKNGTLPELTMADACRHHGECGK
jgi:predicted Fe-Mo cluster-binding NifX family protein